METLNFRSFSEYPKESVDFENLLWALTEWVGDQEWQAQFQVNAGGMLQVC